jgi:hypothetical protein
MKKLFRTSKSTVDPLPPPSIPPPPSANDARSAPPPPPAKKGFQALMGGGNGGNHNNHNNVAHEPPHEHPNTNKWGFLGGPEKVTPFPIDMGRDHPPSSGGVLKKKEKTKVPTLQEMQSPPTDWRGSNGHGYDTPPSATHPYLPPGARPPSPPPALRPGTPTRYPYTTTPSQSSQTSVHRESVPVPGRDRGYSSASESEPPVPLPKMQPVRSPLAYHPPPSLPDQYSSPPQHQQMPLPQPHHPAQPQQHPIQSQQHQYHPQHNLHPEQPWSPGQDDMHHRDREEPKEKKKFWGVAWGDKKDKHKDKERDVNNNRELARPVMPMEERRPSFEGWRGENESVGHGSTGHHSHHSQSLNHSNYGHGQHIQMSQAGHNDGYSSIESAENVTQAIGTYPL